MSRALLILVLAALPAVASAQRGANVRGERAGDIGGRGFQLPRVSDLEDHSPVGILLDKKKKLSLSDSQVTALKGVAKALQQRNAEFYRGWDSVRVVLRSASGGAFGGGGGRGAAPMGGASAVDREAMGTARTHLAGLMRAIRENNAWSRQESRTLLNAEQQAKADEFWKEDDEEFWAALPAGAPNGRARPGV
ncbi:MAG: hypothetical protein H3C62_01720 [Gemmatimonadaceae bacterium]|nr:hypothetical protein [Gemmatimonadaceae bacterium]